MTRSYLHGALLIILAACSTDSGNAPSGGAGGTERRPDASAGAGGAGGAASTGSGGSAQAGSGAGQAGQGNPGGAGGAGGAGGTAGAAGSAGATSGGSAGVGGTAGAGGAPTIDAGGAGSAGRPADAGRANDGAVAPSSEGGAPTNGFAVDTNRYDNARTGSNTKETILNTTNVKPGTFGLLFSRTIVGGSYGQPLYVSGVTVGGVKRNVVYVATMENNVYAFDADSAAATAPIWQKRVGAPLALGGAAFNPGCADMQGSGNVVGITSTPVISVADNKIYVVSKGVNVHNLSALDLSTGADAPGSPAVIGAGMADFNPNLHVNRPGLLLVNGVIYIAYGSHCDYGAYHGFVFGHDATTLQRTRVYNTTAAGSQGAIWQSGTGLSSDGTNVFATVGNGTTGNGNMSQNVIELAPAGASMTVARNFQIATVGDNDLGSSGASIMGALGQIVTGDKDGDLLLIGKSDFLLKQRLAVGGEVHNVAFWEGSAGPMVFTWPDGGGLRSYKVAGGMLTAGVTNTERRPPHPGGIFTISSNGATPGTGIVWASIADGGDPWHSVSDGALFAFDAANVAAPSLWNSLAAPADDVGRFAKFGPPTVANGKVYLATFSGKLQVYGLK